MAPKNVQLVWSIMANISIIIAITGFYIVLRGLNLGGQAILTLAFFVIALAIQIGINIVNAKSVCINDPSNNHMGYVFGYTLLPYFLILGSIMLIIKIFPGWKAPFSNTIGYLFVKGAIKKNLGSPKDILSNMKRKNIDFSSFINELTEDNFNSSIESLNKLNSDINFDNSNKTNVLKLIRFKQGIAEGIWYLLAGSLAVSVSTNSILNIQC